MNMVETETLIFWLVKYDCVDVLWLADTPGKGHFFNHKDPGMYGLISSSNVSQYVIAVVG